MYLFHEDSPVMRHMDAKVVKHTFAIDPDWKPWPGLRKNVVEIWELETGKLIGRTDTDAGWTFPIINKPKDW